MNTNVSWYQCTKDQRPAQAKRHGGVSFGIARLGARLTLRGLDVRLRVEIGNFFDR
jgi:hypothetical protein